MVSLLAKIFIKDHDNTSDQRVRQSYGVLCGGVGILLNIFLFAGKMLAGIFSGSIAITADAFNNLSDAGSSVITLAGFKMAGQKPDSDHPFGHGRLEYISGFLVSVVILIMAFELLKTSVEKVIHPKAIECSPMIIGILIMSILVKIYMFYYNKRVSSKIDSAAMDAAAKDSLSDTVATLVVLVTALLAYYTDVQIDGFCGIVVALFVFWTGYEAARETISPLLGQPPEPEFVAGVERIILSYGAQGVQGFHDLVVHNYGPGRVMLSVHVEVPAEGDILVLHDMIDEIEHRLAEELHCNAVIHMDPVCLSDGTTNELRSKVARIIAGMEGDVQFHDFRIVHCNTCIKLAFDVVVPYQYGMSDREIVEYIQSKVAEIGENYVVVIEVDKADGK